MVDSTGNLQSFFIECSPAQQKNNTSAAF